MKLSRRVWFFFLVFGLSLSFGLIGQSIQKGWWNGGDDFRILSMEEGKISLISISPRRGLINELDIDPTTKVWIPGGLGWYEAGKLYRLMTMEKKRQDIAKVVFFNYGFWPNITWWSATNDRWDDLKMWLSTGWLNGIRLKWVSDSLLIRRESLVEGKKETQLGQNMSDSGWLENDMKITVVNNTGYDRLAEWLGDRLSWSGLAVVSLESGESSDDDCKVVSGIKYSKGQMTNIVTIVGQRLGQCLSEYSDLLSEKEIEIVLGKRWAEMIQYPSYVRSF